MSNGSFRAHDKTDHCSWDNLKTMYQIYVLELKVDSRSFVLCRIIVDWLLCYGGTSKQSLPRGILIFKDGHIVMVCIIRINKHFFEFMELEWVFNGHGSVGSQLVLLSSNKQTFFASLEFMKLECVLNGHGSVRSQLVLKQESQKRHCFECVTSGSYRAHWPHVMESNYFCWLWNC